MNLLFSTLSRYVRFSERGRHKAPSGQRSAFRPRLEVLEDRALPSAYVVTTTACTGRGGKGM